MSIPTIVRRLRKPALVTAAAYMAVGIVMAAPKIRADYRAHHRTSQQRRRQPALNMSFVDRLRAANHGNIGALRDLSPAELACATLYLRGSVVRRLSGMGTLANPFGEGRQRL